MPSRAFFLDPQLPLLTGAACTKTAVWTRQTLRTAAAVHVNDRTEKLHLLKEEHV